MYVSEICAEGNFVTFPWWLKNVKSRSKIARFSNERHFEIWIPKKRKITVFWSKLSKLHKKDQILHVATTFSLKQGETRTSHGPIPHPLTTLNILCQIQLKGALDKYNICLFVSCSKDNYKNKPIPKISAYSGNAFSFYLIFSEQHHLQSVT